MKNVTITMDEEVARWAKVRAAERDISLSRMLGETLKEQMRAETRYDQAEARFFSRPPRPLKSSGIRYPDRGDVYER